MAFTASSLSRRSSGMLSSARPSVVGDAEQVLGEARDGVGPRLVHVLSGPPPGILGVRERTQELVLERRLARDLLVRVGIVRIALVRHRLFRGVVIRLGGGILGLGRCVRVAPGGVRFRLGPFRLVLHGLLRLSLRRPCPAPPAAHAPLSRARGR